MDLFLSWSDTTYFMYICYILVGSFIGGCLRFILSSYLNPSCDGRFPFGTFVVNCLGSLLFAMTLAHNLIFIDSVFTEMFLLVGVLGGFTTFSAFCLDGYQLVYNQKFGLAFLYLVGTTIFAICGFIVMFVINGSI
jgi:CrcB protein